MHRAVADAAQAVMRHLGAERFVAAHTSHARSQVMRQLMGFTPSLFAVVVAFSFIGHTLTFASNSPAQECE